MRTIVIVFFCLAASALAALVHITEDLGQTRPSYVVRDYVYDDIVFDVDQNFNNDNRGDVEIYARSITIPSGVTISARGIGALGGGGGGGGGGRDGWDGVGAGGIGGYWVLGAPAQPWWGTNGNSGDWGGRVGLGGPGGAGGVGQTYESDRGAVEFPYSEKVYRGDGGNGGAGGGGGGGESWTHHDEEGAGGGGGGGGGRGGGCVSLFAANRIFVGGNISSEGGAGGAGGPAGDRTTSVLRYGGPGGDGGESGQPGGAGGLGRKGRLYGEEPGQDGSAGSPGDILLACYSGDIEVHGFLYANTVKVFYGGLYTNTSGGAGGATVWTNSYSNVTEWAYSSETMLLPFYETYVDQPAQEATVTEEGDNYVVVVGYTNEVPIFNTNDVSVAYGRGNGDTNVVFVTFLKFEVPVSASGEVPFDTVSYASSYSNGVGSDRRWWYMGADGSYAQQDSPSYVYRDGVDVGGSLIGKSLCKHSRVVGEVVGGVTNVWTNYGPSSISIQVTPGDPPYAMVPALTNFWIFPTNMSMYELSPSAWHVTNEVITNRWSVAVEYEKEMNGERPRQSWQSDSTREWPMPNQESGWR